jgi:hypothetical protein
MHPIADKAETALDFPDEIYMGQFGQHSRFEAAIEPDGVLIGLSRQDDEKREVQTHLRCFLFADVLAEIAGSAASRRPIETLYRDPLIAAVRDLSSAQAPAIMAAD